ncbi:hypothetical protein [Muricoccus radiodurans]|uniref:hypothetical protein n=1 Tax=Muricoccus radiodurans TaxID=2231721 RepID=UPI003CF02C6B
MSSRLWSLGVFLVALGIAAYVVGWNTLLWLPMTLLDSLWWVPASIIRAIDEHPATVGVIVAGVLLMVVARLVGRRRE